MHHLAFAVACAAAASVVSGQCRVDGSPGFQLPLVKDAAGNVTCGPGFYCPNLDPANSTTWPVACTPPPACQVDRLFAKECDTFEIYEPRLCEEKKYCPVFNQMLECPSGHYCLPGTKDPVKCEPLSFCPAGTEKPLYFGGILFSLLTAVAAVLLQRVYCLWYRLRLPAAAVDYQQSLELSKSEPFEGVSASPKSVATEPSMGSGRHRHNGLASTQLFDAFQHARGERAPIQIDATDVTVTMPDGKVLLHGVNGTMQPGKVTAIMGPTGAGKTMFMTTLLGGVDPAWHVGGALKVNGEPVRFGGIRRQIGFVPQDDVLHTELTVDGNLYYSSEMRLPKEWTADERARLCEAVVQELGLVSQRTDVVGVAGMGDGISASQRKRVSVGVELASAPLVLFLDEPTSGLDSTTSLELVRLLKDIALAVRLTVVMVVHQPRVEIWDELDEVLLLAPGGRTVFQGSQAAATQHFIAHGAQITPRDNPADIIMDTIAANADELTKTWAASGQVAAFETNEEPAEFVGQHASFLRQVMLVHRRSVEKQLAAPLTMIVEASVMVLLGFLMGYSSVEVNLRGMYLPPYNRISPIPDYSYEAQVSMYHLMCLGLGASVAGVNLFGGERPNYFREAQSGMNRLTYFLGMVSSAVYRVTWCSLCYTALYAFIGQLPMPFGVIYATTFLCYWCFYGVATCVAVTVDIGVAPLIATMLSQLVCVFNGYISFPIWIKKIFFTFYVSQIIQEEKNKHIKHWTGDAMGNVGYNTGRGGLSYSMLFIWFLVLYSAALVLMVFTHRDRQR